MFRTFSFEQGKSVRSPAYFVENEKEEIVQDESWVCTHQQKYKELECDPYTIVESCYDNHDVDRLTVRHISLARRKEMSVFLLVEMEGGRER